MICSAKTFLHCIREFQVAFQKQCYGHHFLAPQWMCMLNDNWVVARCIQVCDILSLGIEFCNLHCMLLTVLTYFDWKWLDSLFVHDTIWEGKWQVSYMWPKNGFNTIHTIDHVVYDLLRKNKSGVQSNLLITTPFSSAWKVVFNKRLSPNVGSTVKATCSTSPAYMDHLSCLWGWSL